MRFHHIYIEILNYCQFNCSFCPKTTREQKALTPKEFTYILNEVIQYTDTIYLHVLGEPLLHPELDEILSICDKYPIKVNITSNGKLIKDKGSILLKHSCINKLNLSLHALDDDGNSFVDEVDYMNSIFAFTKEAIKHQITVIYRLWDTNKQDNKMFKMIQENYPEINLEQEVSPQNGIRLEYRVFLHQANQFVWPIRETKQKEETGYCLGLKSHLAILSNGDVVPCCLDNNGTIKLGNIFKQPLGSIIEGELAQAIKIGFQNHKAVHPLCQSCSYRERFNKE